jgi:hypothetical protein
MINDSFNARGTVKAVLRNSTGEIKEIQVSNTIVNFGKTFMTSRLFSTASDAYAYHIGIGDDNTAVAASQVQLVNQLENRVPTAAPTSVTTVIANDTLQLVAMFGLGETTLQIQEAGLFTALTGSNMIARTTFGLITKTPDDTLTITWKIQQA